MADNPNGRPKAKLDLAAIHPECDEYRLTIGNVVIAELRIGATTAWVNPRPGVGVHGGSIVYHLP